MASSRWVRGAGATVVAVALLGCGGEDNVGERWAKAVDDERWADACELMLPRGGCERQLEQGYAGRDVQLLDAGSYQQGSNVTDNEKRFAISAEAGGERSTTYYEIERRDGRDLVDLQITVVAS